MNDLSAIFDQVIQESVLMESAVDAMRDRFHQDHGLHPDVFNHLYHNALPDHNKSLGDMEWMANREVKGENVAENHENVKHVMTEFAKPDIKAKLQKKKANQYKTFQDLHDAVAPHIGSAPTKKESEESDTKTIYKSDTHIIKQHLSHESMVKAAYLPEKSPYSDVSMVKTEGGKCKATWCVSADSEQGKAYYSQYTENGRHPFYTIEHTDKHPSMPNRKFAVLADPYRNQSNHEVRDELQLDRVNLGEYAMKNQSVLHTSPGKYISGLIDLKKNEDGNFSYSEGSTTHHIKKIDGGYEHTSVGISGQTTTYGLNDSFQKHGNFRRHIIGSGLDETGSYLNDKMHGDFRTLDSEGMVRSYNRYDNNELKSSTDYNAKGIPEFHKEFNNGKEVKSVVYHDNGRVLRKIEHHEDDKGNRTKKVESYYDTGLPRQKTATVNEKFIYHKEYHLNGALKHDASFKDGEKHGIQKSYHPSGNLSLAAKYVRGDWITTKEFSDSENVKDVDDIKNKEETTHTSANDYIKHKMPFEFGFADKGIDHYISEDDHKITLDKLVVPKETRGNGLGSRFMTHLTTYADLTGKRVELTPSTDFGATSKARLVKFYKGHGFVENKGRNKDFSISNTMYRHPDKSVNESIQSTFRKMIEG